MSRKKPTAGRRQPGGSTKAPSGRATAAPKAPELSTVPLAGDDASLKLVGMWLRQLRESKGLTLTEMVARTNFGKSQLSKLEAGDAGTPIDVRVTTLARYLAAVGGWRLVLSAVPATGKPN